MSKKHSPYCGKGKYRDGNSSSKFPTDENTDGCFEIILNNLKHKHSHLSEKDNFSWDDVREIDFDFHALRHVEFTEHKFLYAKSVIARCGRNLLKIKLSQVCDSRILQVINGNCDNLTELDIDLIKYNTDHLSKTFENLQKLRRFTIWNLKSIPDEFFAELKDLSTSVQEVEIKFRHSSYRCSPSRELHIFREIMTNLKSLRHLSFQKNYISNDLMDIICQKTDLFGLNLQGCRFERKESLTMISRLEMLEILNLSEIAEVDDDIFESVVDGCKNLKYLNLSFCDVTDYGISKLAELENLESLQLKMMDREAGISDASLVQLNNLTFLDISGNKNIDDNAITRLLQILTKLQHLDLVRTGITLDTVAKAALITNERSNGLELTLLVCFNEYLCKGNNFSEPKFQSPLLKVFGRIDDSKFTY